MIVFDDYLRLIDDHLYSYFGDFAAFGRVSARYVGIARRDFSHSVLAVADFLEFGDERIVIAVFGVIIPRNIRVFDASSAVVYVYLYHGFGRSAFFARPDFGLIAFIRRDEIFARRNNARLFAYYGYGYFAADRVPVERSYRHERRRAFFLRVERKLAALAFSYRTHRLRGVFGDKFVFRVGDFFAVPYRLRFADVFVADFYGYIAVDFYSRRVARLFDHDFAYAFRFAYRRRNLRFADLDAVYRTRFVYCYDAFVGRRPVDFARAAFDERRKRFAFKLFDRDKVGYFYNRAAVRFLFLAAVTTRREKERNRRYAR